MYLGSPAVGPDGKSKASATLGTNGVSKVSASASHFDVDRSFS